MYFFIFAFEYGSKLNNQKTDDEKNPYIFNSLDFVTGGTRLVRGNSPCERHIFYLEGRLNSFCGTLDYYHVPEFGSVYPSPEIRGDRDSLDSGRGICFF